MKRLLQTTLLFVLALLAACKNRDELNILDSQGLRLYWHHQATPDKGRHLLMSFENTKQSSTRYDYKFNYKIEGRTIDVRLVETINQGDCPVFPGWALGCASRGNIYISENALSEGKYQFRLKTGNAVVTSQLLVGEDEYELIVPSNPNFTNDIPKVYAVPKNIVYGSVWYEGSANEKLATALLDDLEKLGLKPATVPARPYYQLPEGFQVHLAKRSWDPDNHLYNLVYTWEGDFEQVIEITKKHYDRAGQKLGVSLYTSNFSESLSGEPRGELKIVTR